MDGWSAVLQDLRQAWQGWLLMTVLWGIIVVGCWSNDVLLGIVMLGVYVLVAAMRLGMRYVGM